MVVYERPPRTTPPVGKVAKANPAVVIVKHKDYNRDRNSLAAPMRNPINEHEPFHIPIEDHLIQQAKENADHRVASSKDEVLSTNSDQSQSTLVHIAPDTGAPGGAVSIVNQVPKQAINDASAARLVSLLPDTSFPQSTANYNTQVYGQSRSDVMRQYAALRNSNPARSMAYSGYRYYGYPNSGMSQNAQARSIQPKAEWQSVYNRLLQRKQSYRQ